MTKKYSLFLTVLFCTYIGGMMVVSLLLPKQEFSPLENRYLEKAPTLSVAALQSGAFMEDAEQYISDHIAGRDLWVALKAWCERLSGKHENNGVYFGKQNTLINRVDPPDWDELTHSMGYLNALEDNVSVPVYFGLIPSAAAIWADRLPAGAPTADEPSIIQQLYRSAGAVPVDLTGALAAHSDEDLYYRTDHHWTSLGAYYGANALLESMGLEPLDLSDHQKVTVTNQFYGTLFSSSGVRWIPPDTIDRYIPADGINVTSYFGATPTQGALYVDSFLDQKDKYSYFLGGNQSLCVIETQQVDAPKVLIVRDSYTDSLAPFLTQRFSELHLFDLRYNLISIQDYVTQHDIDAVVVLYSFSNFMAGTNLFALGR
ncbi:MAG: DHHW family protein [Lawsonibacter sp.]